MNRDPLACGELTRADSWTARTGVRAVDMIDRDGIRLRWETLGCKLDERGRSLFAANEVRAAGRGALIIVSKITGLASSTINRGEDDLEEGPLPEGRVRRKGGGPKPLSERDPTLCRIYSALPRCAPSNGYRRALPSSPRRSTRAAIR